MTARRVAGAPISVAARYDRCERPFDVLRRTAWRYAIALAGLHRGDCVPIWPAAPWRPDLAHGVGGSARPGRALSDINARMLDDEGRKRLFDEGITGNVEYVLPMSRRCRSRMRTSMS